MALGFLGLDLPADIRDLLYDITNWKLTPSHALQTILDAAALLPVVGSLKYTDEAIDAVKGAVKYGDNLGKIGKIVNNPKVDVDWDNTTIHGIKRMNERNITHEMVNCWVKEGKVLFQSSGNFVFITREGVAVLNKSRQLVTAYTKEHYDENMKNIITKLFAD